MTAQLIDVGAGTNDSDYAGKDIKGKIVLIGAQPADAQELAVGRFGAAGMVSYAQNQKTAWSGDNDNLIRWGHLAVVLAQQDICLHGVAQKRTQPAGAAAARRND